MRALVVLLLAGCALLGDPGGGHENLPVSGARPFGKLSDIGGKTAITGPFVVTDPLSPISDPSPVVMPDGSFRIFYTHAGSEIWRVDLPSLDPLYDGGRLAAHRVFWDVPLGSKKLPDEAARRRTVTELIFVPDEVADGRYLLTIQIPNIISDAVPSRPILFYLDADE